MKSYEFSRYYNPRIGRFVYRHKGTGLIVDNIFKPMRKVAAKAASAVFSKFAKPVAKKALQSESLTLETNSAKKPLKNLAI